MKNQTIFEVRLQEAYIAGYCKGRLEQFAEIPPDYLKNYKKWREGDKNFPYHLLKKEDK